MGRYTARILGSVGFEPLLARATDAKGDAQPDKHDRNYGTYVINHPLPIEVFVAPGNGN